jgi:hypothetical protein
MVTAGTVVFSGTALTWMVSADAIAMGVAVGPAN